MTTSAMQVIFRDALEKQGGELTPKHWKGIETEIKEHLYPFYPMYPGTTGNRIGVSTATAKAMKRQLETLEQNLHNLSKDTRYLLDGAYCKAFPCPAWEVPMDALKGQGIKTAIVRPVSGAGQIEIVHVQELIVRLRESCRCALMAKPKKGRRNADEMKPFLLRARVIFEAHTQSRASATESAAFSQFVGAVIAECDPSAKGSDLNHRHLIAKVLRHK